MSRRCRGRADRSACARNTGAFTRPATFRLIGAQYDDDRNDFGLERRVARRMRAPAGGWSRPLELFGAIENAFDEEIDTGRTPIRTSGAPRICRAGAIQCGSDWLTRG